MQLKQIIIAHHYFEGSAATNRMLAYAYGFCEQGIKVLLIFASEKDFDLPDIGGIELHKCIGSHYCQSKLMAETIKRLYISKECAIITYGTPTLCWYLPRSKYNIFYECTEIPFYGRKRTLRTWVKETIKRFLAQRATGMLVISKALANYFKKQGIRNIAIINMFVDSKRFENINSNKSNERLGLEDDTKENYVAYCGKISPFKDGVDCLIESFALFVAKHNDYILKIIGGFENSEAERCLKALVNKLKLDKKVVFTGAITPAEMPRILCGAQMLALARPDNEQAKYGFPTKLGEYLATGKPVVVTRVGEIGDFLKDGVNCRMSEPDSPEAFADCMSWVADHYEDALKLGAKGKELTRKEFSSLEQSKKVLIFMKEIINHSS